MGLGLPGSLPSYHIIYTFCCLFLMANKIVVVVTVVAYMSFSHNAQRHRRTDSRQYPAVRLSTVDAAPFLSVLV